MLGTKQIAVIAIAAVIVAAVAVVLASGSSGTKINGPTAITVGKTPVSIELDNAQYIISLHQAVPGSGVAYLYISRSPVLINPALNVTVELNNYTKVDEGVSYANLEIELNKVSNSVVSLTLAPLPAYLNELPDYSRISPVGTTAVKNITTSVLVTSTSVSSTTTIVNQTAAAEQRILGYVKLNPWYVLMLNYSNAYSQVGSCSSEQYNESFATLNHFLPSGPASYQNVTYQTPTALSLNITSIGGGDYDAIWSASSADPSSRGPAVILTLNLTTGQITNTTTTGVFKDLDLSDLESGFTNAQSIGNSCGILLA